MKTYKDLVKRAQEILSAHCADNNTPANVLNEQTLTELLGLFDGPEQRSVEAAGERLTLNELQELSSRTLPTEGKQHWFGLCLGTPSGPGYDKRVDLVHAAFGMAGEAGEVVDLIKKSMYYGKPLDLVKVKEEAGDLLWYIAAPLCRALGCSLEELAAYNVAKLRKRYPEKYTDGAAIARVDVATDNPEPYPPKPSVAVCPSQRLRVDIPDDERRAIVEKYKGQMVDFGDGYYWSDDDRAWVICPELWQSAGVGSGV